MVDEYQGDCISFITCRVINLDDPIYHVDYQRANWLLERWLSPSQRQQMHDHDAFNVIGSHGGKYVVSIHPYCRLRRVRRRWLFFWLPPKIIRYCVGVYNASSYDAPLALKVMLETNEHAVLKKANRMR